MWIDSRVARDPVAVTAVPMSVETTGAASISVARANDGDEAGTLAAAGGGPPLDVQALQDSVALAEQSQALGQVFYAELFTFNPELRDLFPASMDAQRSRLVSALLRIVGSMTDPVGLVPFLNRLGRDHRKFGVITQHYAPFGEALVRALRKVLDSAWTARHEAAWITAYEAVARVMVAGAHEDAVVAPPWWDAEVVFHRRILDDVAVIQARPHTTYPYRPGQHCSLSTLRRPRMWRTYSFASAPRDDGLLEFHVKAVAGGPVSSALVWRTEPGEILRLGAAHGNDLAKPRSERDLLCVCAGTGVAPVLAGIQELEQRRDGRRMHIFYAGRDRYQLYALPHLESIGLRYRRLTVVPVVSPDESEDRSPEVIGSVVASYGDWRRHDVFVAGPTTMVQRTLARLREQGVPKHQIADDDYAID